jgi:hypothetical protein
MTSPSSGHAITRRGFLLGMATGLAAGVPLTWLGTRYLPALLANLASTPTSRPLLDDPDLRYALPGRYPGRVIEVKHPQVIRAAGHIDRDHVATMIDRGMAELTGTDPRDRRASWGTFFEKGDVVGIKVNPVGRKPRKGEAGRVAHAVGAISNPEVLVKVINCLRDLGIPDRDIIVFERYGQEFIEAGYADLMEREFPDVRWCASALRYSNEQVDLAGFDQGRQAASPELARHIVGYDPDVFTVMGYCHPAHDKKDDRRFRSHLSLIVSRLVNKVITLPVLKDHRSAGVTLALKNLSHGMNNNVARSHLNSIAHGLDFSSERISGPNQCNTFIPQAVAQPMLRQRATLHLLDGLIGVYEGGPGCWNRTWGTWYHRGLFFATDPVALDHVGWDIIDAKRAELGWPPVEKMGLLLHNPAADVHASLAALATHHPAGTASLAAAVLNRHQGQTTEVFNVRQPDHIVLAGQLGLGVFPGEQIDYRCIHLKGSASSA